VTSINSYYDYFINYFALALIRLVLVVRRSFAVNLLVMDYFIKLDLMKNYYYFVLILAIIFSFLNNMPPKLFHLSQ
jgi:hypothetical protein